MFLQSLAAAFRLPDVRKKIIFTLAMFAVYCLGVHIPLPGINRSAMDELFRRGGDIFGLINVFSGGAFRRFTIFAMGVMPYINASIIFQLLSIASPTVERWHKEGEYGRKKISKWTRILTVVLAMVQATGLSVMLRNAGILEVSSFQMVQIVITLTAGTAFLMWLGEQITDNGIGNGISLIIFVGIMISLPGQIIQTAKAVAAGAISPDKFILFLAILLGMIVAIVFMQQAHRKIPVQYAKRVVGNRIYGGQSSFLPLRLNQAGVIPIIFAIAVISVPTTIVRFLSPSVEKVAQMVTIPKLWHINVDQVDSAFGWINKIFAPELGHWSASLIYFAAVFFFTYFYTAVTFKPMEIADDLKKWGSFVPGIRPGRATAEHLNNIMTRVTTVGAVFLGVVALAPFWVPTWTGVTTFGLVGGTSLLIVVGVALDTMQQLEAHLVMRQYEGFVR